MVDYKGDQYPHETVVGKAQRLVGEEGVHPAEGTVQQRMGSVFRVQGKTGTDHYQVETEDEQVDGARHGVMPHTVGRLRLEEGVEEEGPLHVFPAFLEQVRDESPPVGVFVSFEGPINAAQDTYRKGETGNEMNEAHPPHNVLGGIERQSLR